MPSSSKDQWRRETLAPVVRRFPERLEEFVTDSGISIDPIYDGEDLAGQEHHSLSLIHI